MAITLKLREEAGELVVTFDDQTVKTALDKLPAIDRLQADPFTNGQVLTAALGGDEMLKRLADDSDNLILLDCNDEKSNKPDEIAWEFATLSNRQFLCVKAGMLRTVPRNAPPAISGALNFIALAADPLVDEGGNPRDGYRLDLDNEMKAIRETLRSCGKNLEAKRIPPTREELYKALRKGPAILHLSCHGNVVDTDHGKMAVLSLETNDGSHDPFLGSELVNTKRGFLRMVVLNACKTATGTEANLARVLALNGVPMTIGMQESIDDRLIDDLSTALYDSLFAGFTFGEALQQARQNIARHAESVGLPVGYVSANGWSEAFPIQQGTPSVGGLGKPGESALGGEIQPPRPLLGRNLELHQIAKHFSDGGKVITVAGTGGMGKTALAAAFAERFAWMWTRGVSGYSFANEVNAVNFRYALMRVLFGNEGAQQGASLSESQQREAILKAAREWSGLWLFDNYESIIQGIQEKQPEAESIHRLIADLANGDADMLLTSREQPAGLRNERLFPDGNHALHGLGDGAGVELFFQHSVKAKENREAHVQFAFDIQRAAEGHPLAIALLAGEYDVSAVTMDAFLKGWLYELAHASRTGLAGHHITFTTAFERSYSHLNADLQTKLTLLSVFPFPFFAQGAAMVWGMGTIDDGQWTVDDEQLSVAKQTLNEFLRRSLLEVDGWFDAETPATHRFQPALRQEAAHRLNSTLIKNQQSGYAAYGAWLANQGYLDINNNIALNRLVHLSMGAMENATDSLLGVKRLRHIHRLAWLKNEWGETNIAFALLNSVISLNLPNPHSDSESARIQSFIRFEMARICITRGDLNRALALFQESRDLFQQLGDKQNEAASLHEMARVYTRHGNLDRALALYEENQDLYDQIGDKKGKAASLAQIAQILYKRGEIKRALTYYQDCLQVYKQIGDKKGQSALISNIATISLELKDLDNALVLHQESMQLQEQLGDKKGYANSLSQMSNVYWEKKQYDKAQHLMRQAIELRKQVGDLEGIAYDITKLGQLSQASGDKEIALSRYRESLALFEKIGAQSLVAQVKQLIANLEGGAVSNDDPLAQVIAQARDASQRGDVQSAIQYQEQAVSLARGAGEGREVLVGLSVMLYNLAGYYQDAERHDDAVKVMEEVVAIDEQTGHQDLESDRKALETIRRIASLTPEERERDLTPNPSPTGRGVQEDGFEAQLQAQLAQLPPEKRAETEAQIRKAYAEFQSMSPEEQAEKLRAVQVTEEAQRRKRVEQYADQAREAGLAYFRRQAPKRDVLNMLEESAAQMKANENPGSPWLEVAEFCALRSRR